MKWDAAENADGEPAETPRKGHSIHYLVSVVVLPISAALYALSLTMHVAEVRTHIQVATFVKDNTELLKLLTTIKKLYETGDYTLTVIITAFTIVFPIGKYLALAYVLSSRNVRRRSRVNTWIKNLGQWSMGDVFVVALLVVILRINSSVGQMHVAPLAGLYVFTASVLTSMLVSALVAFEPPRRNETRRAEPAGAKS
ncbi:MAG: paraquat-inducible protein A [Candidatus Eisenbacteria bacterium]|uniref:Paraquat-inducible protein A n=1 Tax=Eiseniibacteriota bacterium TaxID=2212470 RepID=A0A956M5B5_UNCEI|nr:paraquat-inducible protein A [Candidatus Eisenbacteria bacterium]